LKDGGGNSFDICLDSQDRIVDPEGGAAKINGEFVARSPLKVDMRKSSSSTGLTTRSFQRSSTQRGLMTSKTARRIEWVWECEYRTFVEGAYYSKALKEAKRRIDCVPPDALMQGPGLLRYRRTGARADAVAI
jgi:hypothetical protein